MVKTDRQRDRKAGADVQSASRSKPADMQTANECRLVAWIFGDCELAGNQARLVRQAFYQNGKIRTQERDDVLAMFSSVGTAPNISVQKYLNARR
jgi:hypothetical protein